MVAGDLGASRSLFYHAKGTAKGGAALVVNPLAYAVSGVRVAVGVAVAVS